MSADASVISRLDVYDSPAWQRARTTSGRPSRRTSRVADPHGWWRRLCWVTPQLALCGDLPDGDPDKREALYEWIAAGVTHIVDTRLERNDEWFVRTNAPKVGYTWVGVDDHGGRQPDWWFDEGVAGVVGGLRDGGKVVVHCHMGVNRGPSMAFAALLALGHDPMRALTAIRAARPIAGVLYAEDAVAWFHRTNRSPRKAMYTDTRAVRSWHQANPIDTRWITSRIWHAAR
ncbi:MAG: dual specificity protein phosphatase family protein [Acidimicrobiales bacterium]|nr:dual specificity protein phosphatase family protein [Acidimicrobiales bacterium]MCB9392190.1 dual specificity protein phosphatase family protein [Acidimicrobiaceae bacterium]